MKPGNLCSILGFDINPRGTLSKACPLSMSVSPFYVANKEAECQRFEKFDVFGV